MLINDNNIAVASLILSLDVCIDDGLDAIRLEMLHICSAAVLGHITKPEKRHCLLVHTIDMPNATLRRVPDTKL